MDTPQQFLSNYQGILAEDTTGIAELKNATKGLNEHFEKALERNSEETYKIIASLIVGLDDNKDISDKEAFDTFTSYNKRTKEYLSNKDNAMFDKLTFADMAIKDFETVKSFV